MTTYWTRYGRVYHSSVCKDNWPNIVERQRAGYTLKLQSPALKSYLAAEKAIGFKITLTGSWRSCAYQSELYRSDPNRYANPNTTLHTQGLAIDVSMNLSAAQLAKVHKALNWRGWVQARPDDEPWHYSYRLKA